MNTQLPIGPSDASNYVAGSVLVAVASATLTTTVIVFVYMQRQALKQAPEGLDIAGAVFFLPIICCVTIILGALLTTSLRRTRLPSPVRRFRLIISCLSLLSLGLLHFAR